MTQSFSTELLDLRSVQWKRLRLVVYSHFLFRWLPKWGTRPSFPFSISLAASFARPLSPPLFLTILRGPSDRASQSFSELWGHENSEGEYDRCAETGGQIKTPLDAVRIDRDIFRVYRKLHPPFFSPTRKYWITETLSSRGDKQLQKSQWKND